MILLLIFILTRFTKIGFNQSEYLRSDQFWPHYGQQPFTMISRSQFIFQNIDPMGPSQNLGGRARGGYLSRYSMGAISRTIRYNPVTAGIKKTRTRTAFAPMAAAYFGS